MKDKEYRDFFVEEEINTGLAFQIRRMREAGGWSQEALAERLEATQAGISRLENPGHGRFSLSTLKRLAFHSRCCADRAVRAIQRFG